MNNHAAIIEFLSLANNGYTFQRLLTHEQFVAAEAAVAAGVVGKRHDVERAAGMFRAHMNNPAVYFLTKDAARLGLT